MKSREDKNEIVDGGLRDAWLAAGLEVPAATLDPGARMRRAASGEGDRRKAAADLKRQRRTEQRKRRAAGLL